MSLKDQWFLGVNAQQFIQRVQGAIVHAAIAVASEVANDVQTLTTSGSVTSGTFTLTYGGQTTAALNWNATAAQIQTALQAISSIGNGNMVCTGGPLPSTGVVCTFSGTLGNLPLLAMTHTDTLTGGSLVVTHTTVGVSFVNHTARVALASKILANPVGYAQLMSIGVADNATVQSDWPGPGYGPNVSDSTADNDIQFQVNSIFNAYT